jgi:hypothetical protein
VSMTLNTVFSVPYLGTLAQRYQKDIFFPSLTEN